MPVPFLPLASLLGGAAIQGYNANRIARKQRAASNALFQRQQEFKDEQNQNMLNALAQYRGQNRQDSLDNLIGRRRAGLTNAIQHADAEGRERISESHLGDTSDTYTDYASGANLETLGNANRLASLFARTAGVNDLFQQENNALQRTNADNAAIAARARAQKAIDEMRIQRAGRGSPLLNLLGSGLTAYGTLGLGSAFGTPKPEKLAPVVDLSVPAGIYRR